MGIVSLDRQVPLCHQPPGRNDCGPYATAMALGFYDPCAADPLAVARHMRPFRVPALGATLPWAVGRALGRHRLRAVGGWFCDLAFLQRHIEANLPVIVIVRPTDFVGCPWYALHYRVLVGFGEGDWHFNCPALPPRTAGDDRPGNVSVDSGTFQRQWRTYLTRCWAVAVIPR